MKKMLCGMLTAVMLSTSLFGTTAFASGSNVATEYSAEESSFEFDASNGVIEKYLGNESRVVIPSQIDGVQVKTIGEDAFSSNEYITSVVIPEGVESIEAEAFLNCPNLKSVNMPDSVKSLGRLAFFMCEKLESVSFSSALTAIKENTFYGCSSLEWDTTLPSTITEIGAHAFAECTKLKLVQIPDKVTVIEEEAFKNCTSITTISIPSSVENLGEGVFAGNSKLTVCCEKDSAAYEYIRNNGIAWKEKVPTAIPGNKVTTAPDNKATVTPENKPTAKPTTKPMATYDITYVLKGGSFKEEVTEKYDGSYSIRLPKPVRKGYEFAGWYTESSYKNKVTVLKAGTTGDKKFYAKWSKVKRPARPVISSVKSKKSGQMTVKLKKKVSGADGYQMVYATNVRFTKNKKTVNFTSSSKTVKKLTKNKRYYVKVRAYKLDSTGSKVYGSYCLIPKTVKIKK